VYLRVVQAQKCPEIVLKITMSAEKRFDDADWWEMLCWIGQVLRIGSPVPGCPHEL
jgi:hypothetical protein